jgi:cytochrome c oxidase subunit 2
MVGRIVVMEPAEFQAWLSGGARGPSAADLGETLFERFGCNTCHSPGGTNRSPSLAGLFGKTVKLDDGSTVKADEDYIRESIINPRAKIVAGYRPIMPTYKGFIGEEGVLQLIAYIKSLSAEERVGSKQ